MKRDDLLDFVVSVEEGGVELRSPLTFADMIADLLSSIAEDVSISPDKLPERSRKSDNISKPRVN